MNSLFPLSGAVIALIAYSAFSISDASVKLAGGRIDPFEAAFIGALCAVPLLATIKKPGDSYLDVFRTNRLSLWLLRTISVTACTVASVVAFTHLPMPETFALIFLMPMFVTLLSVLVLKEKVSPLRWTAVIIGFIGVLIVLRPGFRTLQLGHFAALSVGFSAAIAIVAYRMGGGREKPLAMFGTTIIGPMLINGLLMIPGFAVPTLKDTALIISYGVFAAFGQLLQMIAARRSPVSNLAAPQYIQMLWGVALSYALFNQPVDALTFLGISVIIASGIMIWLQGRKARETSIAS